MERFNLDVEIQIIGNCINSTETFLKVMDKGIGFLIAFLIFRKSRIVFINSS
ncbi:hypothetical protein Q604_UNBC10651G0001, partial [human gut metagenome]